jgi:hypothetical protein
LGSQGQRQGDDHSAASTIILLTLTQPASG